MIEYPDGLLSLSDRYDVLLSDVWGVIHNGREHFPAACAALARWKAEIGPVVLISNSPRPAAAVVSQLDELGVPRAAWSEFVTSGDATRQLLGQLAPGPAWRIGPTRDAPLYDGLGMQFSSIDDARLVTVTGPDNDETETPEDYRERLQRAAQRGLPLVCANPDKVVQRGDRLIYCGGALADLYADLGGKVLMAGKPFAPIYELSCQAASRALGRLVDPSRILCIGDGLPTDVQGAQNQGLDCLFVLGGIHAAETTGPAGSLDPAAVSALLAESGLSPRYAMGQLVT